MGFTEKEEKIKEGDLMKNLRKKDQIEKLSGEKQLKEMVFILYKSLNWLKSILNLDYFFFSISKLIYPLQKVDNYGGN